MIRKRVGSPKVTRLDERWDTCTGMATGFRSTLMIPWLCPECQGRSCRGSGGRYRCVRNHWPRCGCLCGWRGRNRLAVSLERYTAKTHLTTLSQMIRLCGAIFSCVRSHGGHKRPSLSGRLPDLRRQLSPRAEPRGSPPPGAAVAVFRRTRGEWRRHRRKRRRVPWPWWRMIRSLVTTRKRCDTRESMSGRNKLTARRLGSGLRNGRH